MTFPVTPEVQARMQVLVKAGTSPGAIARVLAREFFNGHVPAQSTVTDWAKTGGLIEAGKQSRTFRNFGWSDEAIAILREKAAEGLTGAQIANFLNTKFDTDSYTRSAIIGKCHRNGIQLKGNGGFDNIAHPWRQEPEPVKRAARVEGGRAKAGTTNAPKERRSKAAAGSDRGTEVRLQNAQGLPKAPGLHSFARHLESGEPPEGGVGYFKIKPGQCKGILHGNEKDLDSWRWCGAVIDAEETYCRHHYELYHQTPRHGFRPKRKTQGLQIARSMMAEIGIGGL